MTMLACPSKGCIIDATPEPQQDSIGELLGPERAVEVVFQRALTAFVATSVTMRKLAVARQFERLAAIWKRDTTVMSSIDDMTAHPAYVAIVSLGSDVLPLLLRDLEENDGDWFPALRAISEQDPVPRESRGRFGEMKRQWLDWGRRRGYAWKSQTM